MCSSDLMRSIKLITGLITDSIMEGKKQFDQSELEKDIAEAKDESERSDDFVEKSEELVGGIKLENPKDKEEKRTKPLKKKSYKPGFR